MARQPGVDFEFTLHAEREMRDDGVDRLDVQNALSRCTVTEEQWHEVAYRYVTVGPDTEGRRITVVVEVEEDCLRIVVVTVWR